MGTSPFLVGIATHSMLDRKTYFIREHVGLLKLVDTYDILDPQTQAKIGQAREEIPVWSQFMRLLVNKRMLPTTVNVYEGSEEQPDDLVFSITRGFTFLRSKVEIIDSHGNEIGYFKQKLLSLGGAFTVFSPQDEVVAIVKGDWKGWNFRFLKEEEELGTISKKWAGLGKELLTSADNYVINIHGDPDPTTNTLLLAAGLAVDTIFKERA
jgi:uncharacterized protein YxjI